jgi:hypothetical protein
MGSATHRPRSKESRHQRAVIRGLFASILCDQDKADARFNDGETRKSREQEDVAAITTEVAHE